MLLRSCHVSVDYMLKDSFVDERAQPWRISVIQLAKLWDILGSLNSSSSMYCPILISLQVNKI